MVCHEEGRSGGGSPNLTASLDTIAAVATPPGQGGVGIVRVSGPRAQTIGEGLVSKSLPPRMAVHGHFHRDGAPIDEGLALFFPGPRSFTGEDVVELHGHGGPVVMQMLLDAALAGGARLALPGEFTERAFLNGKLDLAQAEAVADLIASASAAAARGALRSLSGQFSQSVRRIDEDVLKLRVYVEAAIDFPDEEVEFLSEGQVGQRIDGLLGALAELMKGGRQGVLLNQGVSVAIIGQPNVGKSSLLNRLSGEEAAIVTDIPGTTRDLLKVDLVLDGLPIRLVDTAGIRQTQNPIEAEGVRRARAQAAAADLVLEVLDGAAGRCPPIDSAAGRTILVENKIDLSGASPGSVAGEPPRVRTSCLTGAGVADLVDLIKKQVGFTGEAAAFSARQRHLEALDRAQAALRSAAERLVAGAPGEIIAEDLRLAHQALGEITGEVTADDLLGSIFRSFCIGK